MKNYMQRIRKLELEDGGHAGGIERVEIVIVNKHVPLPEEQPEAQTKRKPQADKGGIPVVTKHLSQ
jgi:hypothetical protein